MATNGGGSWFRRLFAGSKKKSLDPTRTDLSTVASSFDDAESSSAALERGSGIGWVAEDEAVFRHHLVLPADAVADAAATAAQDGYELVESPQPAPVFPVADAPAGVVDAVEVTLQRVQVVDALHCSQERSRMAGLAQRRGGVVRGWDALQPGGDSTPPR
ncbi:MAG: hypothetical protein WBQ44_12460 [Rhodococcus sp. (in: high G+C Gram-positive bacteria)]